MKEMYLSIIAGIATASVYLLGGFDIAIQCLQIGVRGLLKKVAILLVVMLAVLIDRVTGESGAIRTLVIYYFVANEGLSITENLAQAGVPMPKIIKDALKALKKEIKGNAKSV